MNILLVEDDPGIAGFVTRGLAAEGFQVHWTRTGAEGRRSLTTGSYAAAILDLGLPDVDGLDLCSAVRRAGVTTPILMLTARGALEDKLDGFRSGADDYLSKPFAFEELLARLTVLARRARPAQPILAGALSLDPANRTATVGQQSMVLPARQFAVLAGLAGAAGRPVKRQALLEYAWGPVPDVADNTLDVYIGYLRKRLAGLPGAPALETVRGVGFRLAL